MYVKEYCRSKRPLAARKPRGLYVAKNPKVLVTEQDLVMREAAQRLQEMPEFIAFVQQQLKGALLKGHDIGRAYEDVVRRWDGQVDFSRDPAVRECVTAVFRA